MIRLRRKDREITEHEKIKEIILSCDCCRLGFCDKGKVYIVPLNFGYSQTENNRTFYFHGAKEGRKIDLIIENKYAGFELDTNYQIRESSIACNFSARYQSVIGNGNVAIIEDIEEKKKALQYIMKHNSGKDDWHFNEEMLNEVCVFKLDVMEIACKECL